MQMRAVLPRIIESLRDANLSVDSPLCAVDKTVDGRTRVVVSLANRPEDDEAQAFMKSAAHLLCLETLDDDDADVHVHVPSPAHRATSVPAGAFPAPVDPTLAAWVAEQSAGVVDLILKATQTLAEATLGAVVERYPWRNRLLMADVVPLLVRHTVDSVSSGRDAPVLRGNVDALLTPLEALLPALDQATVHADVTALLGRPPLTLLECYEAVYRMAVVGPRPSGTTIKLFYALFVLPP